VGIDDQFPGRIAVIEGAVLGATRRADLGKWPDPTTENLDVAVLVHETRQDSIDLVTGEHRHRLGDTACLRLDTGQFHRDVFADLGDLRHDDGFACLHKLWGNEALDAQHREQHDQKNEADEGGCVTSFDGTQREHGS